MKQDKEPFSWEKYIQDILVAVKRRIEGSDDPRRKFDYLMDPPNIKTSSILTEMQLDSVAESSWLGDSFPSLGPLKDLSVELAEWSPSKTGKGRDQLTATMISEHKEIIPMSIQQLTSKEKKKKEKEESE
jgi:hypothetical protein